MNVFEKFNDGLILLNLLLYLALNFAMVLRLFKLPLSADESTVILVY